ncbi:unnamed protein product [Closterium sp. Yama58-4]|nr:unnamed protein product [Closterium sp. Yama58-4]
MAAISASKAAVASSVAFKQCGFSSGEAFGEQSLALKNTVHLKNKNQAALSCRASVASETVSASAPASTEDPLLLRAVRGEKVERPPVWLMRQAGRYMKVYQDLCKKHKTFRERSENVDLSVEISLQPWRAFKPDGIILFSDILTPLTGMNIPFDIVPTKGPIIHDPIRTAADVAKVQPLDPDTALHYVGETLQILRKEAANQSTVLGFVGAPFTMASYIVEGSSSKNFSIIKRMAFSTPEILHALLAKLAESTVRYMRYQADNGAQAIQIFDSWATSLSPCDFEVFSLPYIKQIVAEVKSTHPDLPIILYASGSGGLLERMSKTGVDVVSVDWTVDMAEARERIGKDIGVQGNVDPAILFGSKETITARIHDTVAKAGSHKHILNLGHGVLIGTPEENVEHFFAEALKLRY